MTHQANQIVPKLASELGKLTPGRGNYDPISSQQLEFTCVWLSLWGLRLDCSCCLRAAVCRLDSAAPGSCRTYIWCDLQQTVIGCDWWPMTLTCGAARDGQVPGDDQAHRALHHRLQVTIREGSAGSDIWHYGVIMSNGSYKVSLFTLIMTWTCFF